ncbi:hypothetical protein [Rhizobium leguminosarum]|uniref:hypothetical protein n=1 Tax=Rhizobium leguminosarum TaxID=384 RepID=UPI003F9C5F8E
MNVSELFKISGSNIVPVVSATAIAVTSTMSASPARSDVSQFPTFYGQPTHAQSPTDIMFALGLAPDGPRGSIDTARQSSQVLPGTDMQYASKVAMLHSTTMVDSVPVGQFFRYRLPASAPSPSVGHAQMASEFFEGLPADTRTDALWEVVSLSFAIGGPTPKIDVVDGMTTIDFSAPGRLVSILIDGDVCHLSAFSRQMELKMTYVSEKDVPRDEFNDILWGQLREFRRPVRA